MKFDPIEFAGATLGWMGAFAAISIHTVGPLAVLYVLLKKKDDNKEIG